MMPQPTIPIRPPLPHENPKLKDNLSYLWQNLLWHTKHYQAPFLAKDPSLIDYFSQPERPFTKDIETLTDYFISAFMHYAYADYSRARYPGLPSILGRYSDSIEGAARNYPLLAAYLARQYQQSQSFDERTQAIYQGLRQGILAATNPKHRGYWKTLQSYHQTVCEAADFALALWLSKAFLWQQLSASEQTQILQWLQQIHTVETVNNNWHLFVLLIQMVIADLDTASAQIDISRYEKIKSFYVGDGWFRDGPTGNFDYYNSWGFHYPLFWIDQINPQFDRAFIHQSAHEFCQTFKYFFAPAGFPFFGRSAPYRFAAPCALISHMLQQSQPDGQVKRIVRFLNEFFIRRHAIQAGCFTQGLFQADRRLLDNYSGSASPLWSLRPLILLLYGHQLPLETTAEMPLEIEKGDFTQTIPAIDLHLRGYQHSGEIIATFGHNDYAHIEYLDGHLSAQNWSAKQIERILGRSTRPKNNLIRKGVTTYSSKMTCFLS